MKVTNRATHFVGYSLPELKIIRDFSPNETKTISVNEMNALWQSPGGARLIESYLLIDDKDWVNKHFDPEIEYFWTEEDVKNCLLNDDIDLFRETLEYAPEGVLSIIKDMAWRMPLSDLNKCQAIKEILGFDVLKAAEIMSSTVKNEKDTTVKRRRREA